MRKYWVHYRINIGTHQGEGEMECSRPAAIRGAADLADVCQAIANQLITEGRVPPGTQLSVGVISWQRFEDDGILLPGPGDRIN